MCRSKLLAILMYKLINLIIIKFHSIGTIVYNAQLLEFLIRDLLTRNIIIFVTIMVHIKYFNIIYYIK